MRPRWSGRHGGLILRDRHARRIDWINTPLQVLLKIPQIALGLAIVLGVLGVLGVLLAIGQKRISAIATPFEVVARIVEWVGIAVSVSCGPVLLALPWIAIGTLWHVGHTAGNGPALARTAGDVDLDVSIDETTVARAL